MNEKVDLETELDIIEIGANAIHVELIEVQKQVAKIKEGLDKLEEMQYGISE